MHSDSHPWRVLFILLCVLFLGSIGIGLWVQHNIYIRQFDAIVYTHINGLPHTALIDRILFPFDLWFLPWKVLFMPAYFYFFLIPFILYMLIWRKHDAVWAILALVLGTFLVGLVLKLDWQFVFRPRPFTLLPTQHLNDAAKEHLKSWPSFPSGHTRDTALYSTIISYFIPQLWLLMTVFTLFIAFTRVYTGEHFPTDVLAGILFGYLAGNAAIIIINQVKNMYESKTTSDKKSV